MRPPQPPSLFFEIVETITTRDEPFEGRDGSWGTSIVRPSGPGWRIADARRERHTKWVRRPVVWKRSPSIVPSNNAGAPSMTNRDVMALRLTLLRGGYLPIPLYGKVPPAYGKNNKRKGLAAWQKIETYRTKK